MNMIPKKKPNPGPGRLRKHLADLRKKKLEADNKKKSQERNKP